MKWRKWILAAVLLAVPVWVWAQVVANDGSSTRQQTSGMAVGGFVRADTTLKVLTMDASGNLMTVETTPAYTDFRDGGTAIIDDTTAISMSDSSAVINMGKYRLHALAIRMVGNPAATARIAIQIRYHLNSQSDTASVFPIMPRAVFPTGGQDTLAYNTTTSPSQIVVGRSEFVVNLTDDRNQASRFGNQANEYIVLGDIFGKEMWAPYISVRIRCLTTSTATVPTFKVYMTGTPQ